MCASAASTSAVETLDDLQEHVFGFRNFRHGTVQSRERCASAAASRTLSEPLGKDCWLLASPYLPLQGRQAAGVRQPMRSGARPPPTTAGAAGLSRVARHPLKARSMLRAVAAPAEQTRDTRQERTRADSHKSATAAAAVADSSPQESRPVSSNRFFVPTPPPDTRWVDRPTSQPVTVADGDSVSTSEQPMVPRPPQGPITAAQHLSSADHVGQTSVGKRVLQWATETGVAMEPHPPSLVQICCAYGRDPSAHADAWRQVCRRGRVYFAKRAVWTAVGGNAARSATMPILSSVDVSVTAESTGDADAEDREHARHAGERGSPQQHAFSRRRPGEALREYRQRLRHARWCGWQLQRFFEQGASYLAAVWPHGSRAGVPFLFCGRFVVPTESRVTEEVRAFKREQRRARLLREMLLAEFGLDQVDSATADSTPHKAPSMNESTNEKGHHTAEDLHAAVTPMRSGRAAENLMLQEPFVDVTFNRETGLLDMGVYVNGLEGGEGATFLSRATAACLDRCRWFVLDGLWRGQVVFFIPHQPHGAAASLQRGSSGDNVPQTFCPGTVTEDMQFMMVDGVCLEKPFATSPSPATCDASDRFICRRCGQVRRRGPAGDDWRQATGSRTAKGGGGGSVPASSAPPDLSGVFFFCRMCRRRTAHVLVCEGYLRLKQQLGQWLGARGEGQPPPSRREVDHWLDDMMMSSRCAAAFLTRRFRRRPEWAVDTHVDTNSIMGSAPPLVTTTSSLSK